MSRLGHPLALLLAACVPAPGLEGYGGRALGEGDAGPATDCCACEAPDVAAPADLPTVRQDLSTWTCRPDGAPQPVAFFDADSTLRVSKSGSVTADYPGDVNILPFVARKIAELGELGYLVAVVSNQGGVGSGHQSYEDAEGALAFTVAQLGRLGARVHYFDFAEAYDEFRKPQPGMGARLDGMLTTRCGAGVDLARSLMIGDSAYKKNVDGPSPDGRPADDFSSSDRLFAQSFGVWFAEPLDAFGWRAFGVTNIATEAELYAFVDAIEAEALRMDEAREDPARALALHREAAAIRGVNGL
ncbi:MAG: HAD-IIIA family hydrolase [Deltaproteobacteria bacterium]|nr:HAD-IIIA family hydrolase [Deltaproteobacteria bacterium]